MAPTDRFVAETTFHVRYAETDAQRIVHHASYVVYFEEGRSAYIRQRGTSYAELERQGFFLAVMDLNVRYRQAVEYDQSVTTRCWVTDLKSRTLSFEYEIVLADSGALCVTGITRHVCLNREGAVTRIPEAWLAHIQG